jgi:membrane protease YdiL (CAAX protease family)
MAIFFSVAFGIPWGTWITLKVRHVSFAQGTPLAFMVAAAFCSLAGIVATYVETGLPGVKDLARRCALYRVSVAWWLYALFLPIGVHMVAIVIYGAMHGRVRPIRPMELFHQWWLFFVFAFGLFQGPLAEELGWRGFLLPRLLTRYSPLLASTILGIVWAAWHPDILLYPIAATTLFTASAVALSALMTVLFLNTRGSVLLAIAMHGSVLPGKEIAKISFPAAPEPPDWLRALVVVALAVIVVGITRKQMTLQKAAWHQVTVARDPIY